MDSPSHEPGSPMLTGPGNFIPPERRQYGLNFLMASSLSLSRIRAMWQAGLLPDREVAAIAIAAARQIMEFAAITTRELEIGQFNANLDADLSAVLNQQDHKGQ